MSDKTRRVLWVHHSAVVGAWRRGRADALALCGAHVTVGSAQRWDEGGAIVEFEPVDGEQSFTMRTFGSHPFLFVFDPRPLWRILRSSQFDVLDFHEEPASVALFELMCVARIAGVRAPVVCYSAQNIFKRYPWPFRMLERRALQRVAAVHSCNEAVGEVLRAKGFTGEVVNLGLGVDLDQFTQPGSDASLSEVGVAEFEDDTRSFRVGFVGRIEQRKGVFSLLNAVNALTNVGLDFVGSGPDVMRLRRAIESRSIGDRVHIRGHVAHGRLCDLYRSFDVVVVPSIDTPSWSEQFGRVVVEAMASGVPVIVSDAGALVEVAGDAALVVPEDDALALSQAIDRLANSPELRAKLVANGTERAQHFSWIRIASDQVALYDRVSHGDELSNDN